MSNPQDDGGRAFPTQGYDSPNHGWIYGSDGMYLRDYFAAAAITCVEQRLGTYDAEEIATRCYSLADAMLAARKEQP